MRYTRDLKFQFVGILKKPFSFRYACAASVVFHFLFLLAGSLILSFFQSPPFYKPPLVFDFVFFPVDEFDNSSSRADEGKKTDERKENLPQEYKTTESREPHRQNLASKIEQLGEGNFRMTRVSYVIINNNLARRVNKYFTSKNPF